MDRPVISNYQNVILFMRDMLTFRKLNEKSFSVSRACKELRRVSPTLVTLWLKGERKVTLDRADELSRLLALAPHEKQYLKDWLRRLESPQPLKIKVPLVPEAPRKAASSHILKHWLNVYVKDACQLSVVKQNPEALYATLAGIASQKRIDQALEFLLRAGYLRRDLQGKIIEDSPLHVVDQKIPDRKVRQFHKNALKIAGQAIDQYAPNQRYANALLLPLDEQSYRQLIELIEETAERLQNFAEQQRSGKQLYQFLINLSPTGGSRD